MCTLYTDPAGLQSPASKWRQCGLDLLQLILNTMTPVSGLSSVGNDQSFK